MIITIRKWILKLGHFILFKSRYFVIEHVDRHANFVDVFCFLGASTDWNILHRNIQLLQDVIYRICTLFLWQCLLSYSHRWPFFSKRSWSYLRHSKRFSNMGYRWPLCHSTFQTSLFIFYSFLFLCVFLLLSIFLRTRFYYLDSIFLAHRVKTWLEVECAFLSGSWFPGCWYEKSLTLSRRHVFPSNDTLAPNTQISGYRWLIYALYQTVGPFQLDLVTTIKFHFNWK